MATLKNTVINDTGHVTLPTGSTAERPASPTVGMIRYNSTLGFAEQYTPDGWQGIAPPPVITTISPTSFNGESGTTITVNGANFDTTATVQFLLTGGSTVNAATTTRVSSSQLTATTPRDFLASESPASVKVNNGSGLAATNENGLTFADVPIFAKAAGSLGTIFDSTRSSYSLSSAAATDAASGSITYSITSGAVPTGMSFNTSTAAITGTPSAVGTDTTSSFTVRALDNAGNTSSRTFTITVKAPVVVSYTSTGSTTFSVPTGLTAIRVLAVGGGGGGGTRGGGGGAGGMVVHPSYPVTPGGSVPVTVGNGGGGTPATPTDGSQPDAQDGGASIFGNIVAQGGGGGATHRRTGRAGGSGGGAGRDAGSTTAGGGSTGNQASGGTAYGNGGGGSPAPGSSNGGGGGGGSQGGYQGGALAGNSNTPMYGGGKGGDGVSSDISGSSVTYAGGGGAGCDQGHTAGAGGSGGGGRGGGQSANPALESGTANTGGGGGSWGDYQAGPGAGNGGSGIVIVKY
jgi:hypothetical protein